MSPGLPVKVFATLILVVMVLVFLNMGMRRTAICAFGRTSVTGAGKVAFALGAIITLFLVWWWWP